MAAWLKMKLGMEVGLGPGHTVRWGPSSPSPKGTHPPIFGPCLLWPNGWMDPDATWYGSRPRPKQHCVRWVTQKPRSLLRGAQPPNFWPMSIVAKCWRDQDETWHGGRPRPRRHCVRWRPSSLCPKRGQTHPNFRLMSVLAKRLHGSR